MNDLVFLRARAGQLRTAHDGTLAVRVVALVGNIVLHAASCDAPELVPLSTLSSNVADWASKPVVFGHPVDRNGRHMSANSPDVLAAQAFGTIRGARVEDRKLVMDCHIDPSKAERIGAGHLVERLRAGETCEVSVGAHVTTDNTPGTHAGKPYARRWLQMVPDHLAYVTRGACSCAHGCGATYQRAAAAHIHMEDNMEDYEPINPYAEHLKQIRAASATEPTAAARFEEQWKAARLRELATEDGEVASLRAAHESYAASLASVDLQQYESPDPYAADVRKLQEGHRR